MARRLLRRNPQTRLRSMSTERKVTPVRYVEEPVKEQKKFVLVKTGVGEYRLVPHEQVTAAQPKPRSTKP